MHKIKAHLKRSNFLAGITVRMIMFIFLIQGVHAETVSETNSNSLWKLWAKPRICVIPSDHRTCKMETDIGWVGFEQADICLSSSEKETALKCWYNTQDGHLLQNIFTEKTITYWLNTVGEKDVLIETQIRIIRFPKKQIRRRRRHIWSLL